MNIERYILCLDTNKYAGNFERQTTAYATGVVGECSVGEEEAKDFFAETDGVADNILDEVSDTVMYMLDDEDGCRRPCAIQPTPGWVNNGMGVHYQQSNNTPPTDEQITTYRDLCRKSKQSSLDMAIHNKWPQENIDIYEKELQAVETAVPRWFPAYNTVGIFLSEPLSVEALQLVVSRAKKYLTQKGIVLERTRLVTLYSDEKSEVLTYL